MDQATALKTVPRGARPPLVAERFRFIQPTLPDLDRLLALYRPAFRSGMITNADLVASLEAAVAERLGVKHCVAVSSCTSGLMLVLRALGVTGRVIVPSFTFFATGHAVLWNALEPVFADCLADAWTIDPASAGKRIAPDVAAILGVHLYGNPCRVDELETLARRHGLKLIFDAAHAFGSLYRGRPVGGFGDAEVFSLSPTKLLVAGEGGLVTTNDQTLARRLRAGRNYGDPGDYDPELVGLNARMSEFQAALALAGLEMIDGKLARHNRIAAMYTRRLEGGAGLGFQHVSPLDRSTYKDYSVHIDAASFGMSRDEAAERLRADNIETRKYFDPPLHRQKLYAGFHRPDREPLLVTDDIARGILSLPIYESLGDDTVEKVALAIRRLEEGE